MTIGGEVRAVAGVGEGMEGRGDGVEREWEGRGEGAARILCVNYLHCSLQTSAELFINSVACCNFANDKVI